MSAKDRLAVYRAKRDAARTPEGQYGGGTVIVWDTGPFDVLTAEPAGKALAAGQLKARLHGEKLGGAFTLVRRRGDGQEQWLLIKKDDEGADRRRKPAKTQPESVLTGRTNEDLA
ncbi:DNA polymerase ligase N-terminal domain-containing protein [Amycolatopsis sp. NPDC059021]|uniref:DNA polymerase ligase N-terminal domain-containing protein n=1 Tax=Amycolatopsis sp. NPDC059021 TaxID=3346704 RepID=UPI00366E8B89